MNIGIMGNKEKKELPVVVAALLHLLEKRQTHVFVDEALRELFTSFKREMTISYIPLHEIPSRCDILFALGGDGTILTAAKIIGNSGVPVLGVNLGKLGFLAGVSIDELEEMIDELFLKKFRIKERMVLQAKSSLNETVFYAMNDVVLDKGTSFRIIDIDTFVDNEYLGSYAADGVIISTPTGSTAYSLASGGPIILPSSDVISICFISPHNLTSRPVVVPASSEIRLKVTSENREVHLTADGQNHQFFSTPIEITISPAHYAIKLVEKNNHRYFETLRTKFLWGRRYPS